MAKSKSGWRKKPKSIRKKEVFTTTTTTARPRTDYMSGVTTARSGAFARQLKALVASKKKDAADVTRTTSGATVTTLSVLTSSTAFATAASGTGLLDCDADEVLINNVRIKGVFSQPALLDVDPASITDSCVRKLLVWFNKPLLVASAAGTIPPITEVLVADTIESLPVTDAANGGRFKVLSDKKWWLGSNTYQAATAAGHARVSGKSAIYFDYKVKVNKMTRFAAPSVSGTPGGHYDSDVIPGRVDKGLLVLYTQYLIGGTVNDVAYTRLNYTG